ncbi:UNVERIFIED_CONTAM: hypothetical protein ABIC26_001654 [Paenibacillus sp. PvR008]
MPILVHTRMVFKSFPPPLALTTGCIFLLIDRTPEREQGMFVPSRTTDGHTYKVLTLDGNHMEELLLPGQEFNYHFVQPLGEEQLLLVGARCSYYGPDQYDLNGKIVNRSSGAKIRELLLGDGIQNVQTTASGVIWAGYFDEGVFGNYGWSTPVGESGLVAFSSDGTKLYTNQTTEISDCYALNVISDEEVWLYYYMDFQLGQITDRLSVEFVNPHNSGASGFIKQGQAFLFDKGYGKHEQYILTRLKPKRGFKEQHTVRFVNEAGQAIKAVDRDFRGDTLLLCEDHLIYKLRLYDIAEARYDELDHEKYRQAGVHTI